MPFPWRFSRQDLATREEFLRDMDRSRAGWVQDLLLLLKVLVGVGYGAHPRVTEALGYEVGCEVDGGLRARLPPPRIRWATSRRASKARRRTWS